MLFDICNRQTVSLITKQGVSEEILRGGSWEHSTHLEFLQHTFCMLRESGEGQGQGREGRPGACRRARLRQSTAPPARSGAASAPDAPRYQRVHRSLKECALLPLST